MSKKIVKTLPPEIRFWRLVDKSTPDECWLWKGVKNHKGYGMFRWRTGVNLVGAHRASWRIAHGEWPGNLHVLHSCNNRACVNPAHLRLGTNLENMQDRTRSGRTVCGEASQKARLSEAQVLEIIRLYGSRKHTQSELGRLFGVGRTTVGYIVRGESWKHLQKGQGG